MGEKKVFPAGDQVISESAGNRAGIRQWMKSVIQKKNTAAVKDMSVMASIQECTIIYILNEKICIYINNR